MQVRCAALDWKEARRRASAEAIIAQMLETDDIDRYALEIPEALWPNDSAAMYFAIAEALAKLAQAPEAAEFPGLGRIRSLIRENNQLDELQLCGLSEGVYFFSAGPNALVELEEGFAAQPLDALAEVADRVSDESAEDIEELLREWHAVIRFAIENHRGLIGVMG